MARKEKYFVIDKDGRDKDKVFKLSEMSARKTEDWAIRAFMGMARAGVEVPEEVEQAGFAGLVVMGMKALASMAYADAKPLLDEMLDCVVVVPDPANKLITRPLIEQDIEEVKTLLHLRKEVFDLHANFSELVARFQVESEPTTAEPGSSAT